MSRWQLYRSRSCGRAGKCWRSVWKSCCRFARNRRIEPTLLCYGSAQIVYVLALRTHGQNDAKARLAADHLLIGFGGFFEWELFDHWTDSRQRAELHGIFGILGRTGGPSLNGFASDN